MKKKVTPRLDPLRAITQHLDKLTHSNRPHRVFEDWIDAIVATQQMEPAHRVSLALHGRFAEDTGEAKVTFDRIRRDYGMDGYRQLCDAYGELVQLTLDGIRDYLGPLYMTFANPNPGTGQFFTPWEISLLMAKMQAGDIERQLLERLEAEPFDPITVMDPCVGSGGMLLAFAAECPAWALEYGLVQFFGDDIDPLCVKMARANIYLFGLNKPARPKAARHYLKMQEAA